MLAHIVTLAFIGTEPKQVTIQVHIASGGLPCFTIVGLPDKTVAESRERVRVAFDAIGLSIPAKRITINLSPADLLKEGSHFDLGIALGLLVAMQVIPQEEINNYIAMGELALDGQLTPIKGALPGAIQAQSMSMGFICPKRNGEEAAWSGNQSVLAPSHLIEIVHHFNGRSMLMPPKLPDISQDASTKHSIDFSDVKGQKIPKRVFEIAAAGNHSILMIGPPGSGKSMLARRMQTITPPLTSEEKLKVSIIASLAGELRENNTLVQKRPFRSPHCSSSMASIIGGGRYVRPGEITLAHLGTLFLDELPEFNRNVLESLRQPMEEGQISIARVNEHITYPARFQLIAAMNPCKCGYYGNNDKLKCRKAPRCAEEYQDRISGPLFDRFDLQLEVQAVNVIDISNAYIRENNKQYNVNDEENNIINKIKIQDDIIEYTKDNIEKNLYHNYNTNNDGNTSNDTIRETNINKTVYTNKNIINDHIDFKSVNTSAQTNTFYTNTPILHEESSAVIAARVKAARDIQLQRYHETGISSNTELEGDTLLKVVNLEKNGHKLLIDATSKFHLSMRGVNRILRVARTIADLGGKEFVDCIDLAEAISYRVTKARY